MATTHIRCTPDCGDETGTLFLNDCGSCLYHEKCAPLWCRCGSKVNLGPPIIRGMCLYCNCKQKASPKDGFLCKEHIACLDAFIYNKLTILGKIPKSGIKEMVEFQSNQKILGDLAYLCSLSLQDVHTRNWKIFLSEDGQNLVHFSLMVKKHVEKTNATVKNALQALEIPENAYAIICDDAKVRRNGWTFDQKRQPVPVTSQEIFEKQGLLTKLGVSKKTALEVKSLVVLYPNAASDLLELHKENKICFVDNSALVCLNSKEIYNESLQAQWIEHVSSD